MPRAKSNGGVGLDKPIAFRLSERTEACTLRKSRSRG